MAFLAQVPTLVYTALLGPDSAATANLARLAFGALLWIVLILLNHGTTGPSPRPSALEAELASPSRAPGAGTSRSSRGDPHRPAAREFPHLAGTMRCSDVRRPISGRSDLRDLPGQ